MRFLVLILLLISISATVVPCCAFDGCSEEMAATSHPDKKDQQDSCSPFSTCAGCSIAAIPVKAPLITIPPPAKCSFTEIRTDNSLPLYAASFWQPPRLEWLAV
jgi:hypothetical protein